MSVVLLPVYSCSFYASAQDSVNEELFVNFIARVQIYRNLLKKGTNTLKKCKDFNTTFF